MMFFRTLALCLLVFPATAIADELRDVQWVDGTPFGLKQGMTKSELEAFQLEGYRPGDVELYIMEPPDGRDDTTFYRAVVTSQLGLCSVDALTAFDREGLSFELSHEFDRRRNRIREALGDERLVNRWRKYADRTNPRSQWGPDFEALKRGEQHYSAIWKRGENDALPPELDAIEMGYESNESFVYIRVRYEFRNAKNCRRELEKQHAVDAFTGAPLGVRSDTSVDELRRLAANGMVADGETPFVWPLARSFGPSLPQAFAFHSSEHGACAVIALSDSRLEAGDGRHSLDVFGLYESIASEAFGPSAKEVGPIRGSLITSEEFWVQALENGGWIHRARWTRETAAILPVGVQSVELSIIPNQQSIPVVRLAFHFDAFDSCAEDAKDHFDDAL